MNDQPLSSPELKQSVIEVFASLLEEGDKVIDRFSITNRILRRHPIPGSDHAPWYVGWAMLGIDSILCKHIRNVKQDEDDEGNSSQLALLPGHKRLQKHYATPRDGDLKIVPLELLTKDEVAWKISQHRHAAKGHEEHARELEDWYLQKFGDFATAI